MSESLNFAGEFGVEDLRIVTPNGEVADLISDVLVNEINIFEEHKLGICYRTWD